MAILIERADGSDATAPIRLSVDTAALSQLFRANFVHRLRLATGPACVALLHPHEDHGNHKSRAYAYGKGKHCPQTDPVDVPITDDLGDGDLEFDASAGPDQEATEVATAETPADGDSTDEPDSTTSGTAPPATDPTETSEPTPGNTSPYPAPGAESTAPAPTASGGTATSDSGNGGQQDQGSGQGRTGSPRHTAALRSATGSGIGGTSYVISAGPSGSAGSFAATPLAPSTKWQVGQQSGDFATSYPVPLPPAPAGEAPEIALSYSSQSVDGRTSATNNQASWIGLGWEYAPGSVQRRYTACTDDGHPAIGDLCWKSDNALLSLAGRSVPLYRNAAGVWHPADDDGVRVQRLTGAVNGARGGEYWVVTDRDGTRYFFGIGRQGTTNKPTGSTWTVPVFGDDTGEPCHATTFAASRCQQAWSWNLDRIVDVHGNTSTFFYAPETNRYGRLASPSLYTSYTRGGTLSRIEYGHVAGHEDVAAPDRVVFTTALRCNTSSCAAPSTSTASSYPDVPVDLICADTYCGGQYTPVFFDTRRLASITTQVRSGSGYRNVDVIALTQTFPSPGDGTDPTLWLSSVTRTGYGTDGTKTTLPAVSFGGVRLANRVDVSPTRGVVPLNMYRVKSVRGELGGVTSVAYGRARPCDKAALPAPATNNRDCFPSYWVPQSGPAGFGWFNKYLVTSVSVADATAGGPTQITRYGYVGGAAWHHDENQIDPARTQSYGLWRGYGTTTVTTGTAVKSTTRSIWFRGMNGDPLPGGTARTARVTDSDGTVMADSEWLAGRQREARQLNSAGVELTRSLTGYYARRTVDGTGLYDSWVVQPNRLDERTRVTDPTTRVVSSRSTRETTTFDPTYDQPTSVTLAGDVATTADDVCALTSYVRNTSAWILDTPSVEQIRAGTCTGALLSRTEHYYDNHALTAAPSRGDETQNRAFTTGTGYIQTKASFDARGRAVSTTDGRGFTSRTNPTESLGLVTGVTSTDALGRSTVTTLDPGRGNVLTSRDVNGHTTRAAYDALGRVSSIWLPGQPDASPSRTYSYGVRQTLPSSVVTSVRQDEATVVRSSTLLDSLGRTVETSSPVDGGRAVAQTRYDDRGQIAASTAPVFSTSGLTTLLRPAVTDIESETRTTYDELGRPVRTALWSHNTLKSSTVMTYFGGAVTTTPPVGTASTTYMDALGRTTRLEQRLDGRILRTRYGYDRLGRLLSVTDGAGLVSSFGYDLLGRQTSATTPDRGATKIAYDENSNVVSTTDARNVSVTTEFDALNRPKVRMGGGVKLAEFGYDRPGALGLPASSTTADGLTITIDAYDDRDRPTSRTVTVPTSEGLLAGSWTTTTTYDQLGNVTAVELPSVADLPAERVTTGYDAFGRPSSLSGISPIVTSTSYDVDGRVKARGLGGGLIRTYDYDAVTGRLTGLGAVQGATALQKDAITYDAVGNVRSVSDLNGQTQCNEYDEINRLVHAWTSGAGTACGDASSPVSPGQQPYDDRFTYADTGRLLSRSTPNGSTQYEYTGLQPDAVTRANGQDFTYDAAGQLETRSGAGDDLVVRWNADGTISGITRTPDGGDAADESYAYSTSGLRMVRRGSDSSVLDLGGTELTSAGGVLTARRYYTSGGTTVAVRTAAGLSWTVADRQGGPAVTVTPDGAVQRQLFGPYGEQRLAEQTDTVRGFLNKPKDISSGLSILDHRSYDAELSRFLSPDPVYDPFNPGSFDAYGYANANPTTGSDPSGLCWGPDIICNAAKGVGGAVKDVTVGTYQAVRHPGKILDYYEAKCGTCSGWSGFFTIFNDFNPVAPIVNFGGNTITGANKGNVVKDLFHTLTTTLLTFSPAIKTPKIKLPIPRRTPEIANPLPGSGTFARVLPLKAAEALAAGKGRLGFKGDQVFITAADDVSGVTTRVGAAQRLSLYTDEAGTVLNTQGDALVTFKIGNMARAGIASPVEAGRPRLYGFKQGGRTGGGAREWLISNGTPDELELFDIQIRPLT